MPQISVIIVTYHWCPVNRLLFFQMMLFLIEKQAKICVRDLNSMERVLLFAPDEFRPIHPLSSSRFGSLANPLPFVVALQCRGAGEAFRSSSAVHLHGLRAVDLARWSSRYRRMPQCQARGPLPPGFSGTRCKVHAGRRQRTPRLALVAGFDDGLGEQGQKPLCRRGFGIGFGEHGLRFGFKHDRFVDDLVSMGDFPHDQERDQDSRANRFAGTDTGLYLYFPSKFARRELVGRIGVRAGSHLPFRQRLHRLPAPLPDCYIGRVFRYSRQRQSAVCARQESRPVDKTTGLRSDHLGKLALAKARVDFPLPLRRIRYFDKKHQRFLVFLTNHMEMPALTVALLYKKRWDIELFFKWIKGNLRLKHYFGTSPNAVKTQIWIAMATYLLVAILHKKLKLSGSLHRTLQILSVHPFEKIALHELLMKNEFRNPDTRNFNQMELFDL